MNDDDGGGDDNNDYDDDGKNSFKIQKLLDSAWKRFRQISQLAITCP